VSEPPNDEDWPTQPGRGKPPQQQAPTRSGRHSQPDWIQPERSHALSQAGAGAGQQPTSQPGRHSQPLLSDETQPLPLYRQSPGAEQWAPPVQPPRFELPPPQFAPGGLWGPPPGPPASQPSQPSQRNTNRGTVVALAILGVLVVGGVTIGLVLSSGGTKKHDSHQLAPSNGPGGASTHDFPSAEPSGLRTDVASGTGVVTAEQAQIAQNAEDVLHAIATDDAAKFCPLIDPVDLQKLLKEKSLASCNEIKLKSTADSPLYQSFAVENPAAITVSGDIAHIPAVAIVPTSFGAVDMRKDSDGNWKFRFYST